MSILSSQHHSFDIMLAAKYGVDEALLIHHFQHWIRINKFKKVNLRDGRYWSYQTRKEIQATFPYWTLEQIRHTCEKLVAAGVLMIGNYNRLAIDKTIWYAFVDEKAFGFSDIDSNNVYERENSQSSGKIPSPCGKIPKALPDTIKEDTKEEYKRESTASPISADASSLCDFFLQKIKERNPEFKEPNLKKWEQDCDKILRIDKRDLEKTKKLIKWTSEHKFWKSNCLSPAKLREKYDALIIEQGSSKEQDLIRINRTYALKIKEKYPEQMKSLSFDSKYASNHSTGKEIPFNLPHETFKDALIAMFGGQNVRRG